MFRTTLAAGACCLALLGDAAPAAQPVSVEMPMTGPRAVTFSPDGKQVAVGGLATNRDAPADGLVYLLDAQTGQQRFELRHSGTIQYKDGGSSGTMNRIHGLVYAPDGRTLAVAAELGLRLWNPVDGKEIKTLIGYGINEAHGRTEVKSAAYSPDGKQLAVTNESKIEFWATDVWQPGLSLDVPGDVSVAFSTDGRLLATAEHNNHVHLWNVADGKQVGEVHAEMGPLYDVAFDPAGPLLAVVGEGGEKLWDVQPQGENRWSFDHEIRLKGHSMSPVRCVAFSPDGKLLATASDAGTLVIYDSKSRDTVATLWQGGPFAFSPDGKTLAVAEQLYVEPRQTAGGCRFTLWSTDDILNQDRMAEQARAVATQLVQSLKTSSRERALVPRAVAVLSGPQGVAAAPILIAALDDREIKDKQGLIFALGPIAVKNPESRAALIKAVQGAREADSRTIAAMTISQLPPQDVKDAVPALTDAALNDETPQVRSAAASALRTIDPAAYRQAVEQARARGPVESKVEKRDGQIVYQGRPLEEWINRLTTSYTPNEIFGRPSPQEPLAAIKAIGPDAVPLLTQTLKQGRGPQRFAAAAGLKALGAQAAAAIDPLLTIIANATDDDLSSAGAAADALAGILPNDAAPPAQLTAMMKSDKPAVRLSAARAIAQTNRNQAEALQSVRAAYAAASQSNLTVGGRFAPPITPRPSIEWMAKALADPDVPLYTQMRIVASLKASSDDALPALPGLLKVVEGEDDDLSRDAEGVIQKLGPKAVPVVRDAMQASRSDRTRQRLAATLSGMGDAGRQALEDVPAVGDVESQWWAGAVRRMEPIKVRGFQFAAREALQQLKQPVQPQFGQAPGNMPPRPFMPGEKPASAWVIKVVTDHDAPQSMRFEMATWLMRMTNEEIQPALPALAEAIAGEKDLAISSQMESVVRRLGAPAVPAVRDAFKSTTTDEAKRRLLMLLSALGPDGQKARNDLMQNDPALRRVYSGRQPAPGTDPAKARVVSADEQAAVADAERTSRPLTNGNFLAGLDGWKTEGGATGFHTFQRDAGAAVTTFGDKQDADTGRLYQCFKVPDDALELRFSLHGGSNIEKTYVALWQQAKQYGRATARNDNAPFEVRWNLTPLRGQVVTLEIVDQNTEGWGFIGAENFRVVTESDLQRQKAEHPGAKFDVQLRGKDGQEIKGYVDTGDNTFVISGWSDPLKKIWTPQARELPLKLLAFTPAGETYDVPDDWNGTISGWAFLLPADADVQSLAWNEGVVGDFWNGASFGWGGLRNSAGKIVAGKGGNEAQRFRYVPTDGNSVSDIRFVDVSVKPAAAGEKSDAAK